MEPKIIYQDDALFVIDKPSGWITNDAETTKNQSTIQSWLPRNFQFPISNSQLLRSGIVHRLDKETSGILIVAKTATAFSKLQEEFKERKVNKTYLALVHGRLEPKGGEVSVPVGRLPWRRDRFGILPGGRESSTQYALKAYYQKDDAIFSLVELCPKTGRTHQIRIHMKYLGHPLVADEFYAGRKTSRNDRKWCPRLFLHALNISFIHPATNEPVTFVAPLADDLKEAMGKLEPIDK